VIEMNCQEKLDHILDLGKTLKSEHNLDGLLHILGEKAREIVGADRCSIFVADHEHNELWTRVAQGVGSEIRIPYGSGVAGYAVLKNEIVIVEDAYADSRFRRDVDIQTGYHTQNILAVPFVDQRNRVIGVFQALNKRHGHFKTEDADALQLIADYAGQLLENALLYEKLAIKYENQSQDLRRSEERFELIALGTNDGVWDWDIAQESIYFSPRYKAILGYMGDEFMDDLNAFETHIHQDDYAKVREALILHMKEGQKFGVTFRMKTKSGHYKWVLAQGQAIWNHEGRAIRMVGSQTDVTDMVEAQAKIEQLLSEQDSFIKNAMHELNTPVAVINMYLEVLSRDFSSDTQKKYMQRIYSATKTLSTIYDDFNFIVNKDRAVYKKEMIDYKAFVKERIEYFDDIAKSNYIEIRSYLSDASMMFNMTQLHRIVDNTISNAIKYSEEESHIEVMVKETDHAVIFRVVDHGIGIKDAHKVFDRYYREKHHKGGFGIGLTIVKSICDENGVKIDVNSISHKGTTFTYSFPKGAI
jgi:PAS domain S-box-containing protein